MHVSSGIASSGRGDTANGDGAGVNIVGNFLWCVGWYLFGGFWPALIAFASRSASSEPVGGGSAPAGGVKAPNRDGGKGTTCKGGGRRSGRAAAGSSKGGCKGTDCKGAAGAHNVLGEGEGPIASSHSSSDDESPWMAILFRNDNGDPRVVDASVLSGLLARLLARLVAGLLSKDCGWDWAASLNA